MNEFQQFDARTPDTTIYETEIILFIPTSQKNMTIPTPNKAFIRCLNQNEPWISIMRCFGSEKYRRIISKSSSHRVFAASTIGRKIERHRKFREKKNATAARLTTTSEMLILESAYGDTEHEFRSMSPFSSNLKQAHPLQAMFVCNTPSSWAVPPSSTENSAENGRRQPMKPCSSAPHAQNCSGDGLRSKRRSL